MTGRRYAPEGPPTSGPLAAVRSELRDRWLEAGGPGTWWPLEGYRSADGSAIIQHFVARYSGVLASLCWHPKTATWWVRGRVRDKWYQHGAADGCLGVPVSDEQDAGALHARIQRFKRVSAADDPLGAIVSHPDHGIFEVHGPIYTHWVALGGEACIGFPETDVMPGLDQRGFYTQFMGASRSRIYWTAAAGAVLIDAPVFAAWYRLGAERSRLGYPVSSIQDGPSGTRLMRFERGQVQVLHDKDIRVIDSE